MIAKSEHDRMRYSQLRQEESVRQREQTQQLRIQRDEDQQRLLDSLRS